MVERLLINVVGTAYVYVCAIRAMVLSRDLMSQSLTD